MNASSNTSFAIIRTAKWPNLLKKESFFTKAIQLCHNKVIFIITETENNSYRLLSKVHLTLQT